MTTKEVVIHSETKGVLPIVISQEIQTWEDLTNLSTTLGIADYIFCCLAFNSQGASVFFGKCRRHEELKKAVEKESGPLKRYIYGQIAYGIETKLSTLVLHQPPANKKLHQILYLRRIFDLINPEFLDKEVSISWQRQNRFDYNPKTRAFTPYQN